MSLYNPVVWQDGMFMKPQHFQQLDRSQQKLGGLFSAYSAPLHWGIKHLELNKESLLLGKVGVTKVEGILQDRTPFDLPTLADLPAVLEVSADVTNKVIYLCCPLPSERMEQFSEDNSHSRYSMYPQEVVDSVFESSDVAKIVVGRLNFQLMYEDDDRSAYTSIPILKVSEVTPEGKVVLDDSFIPTCIDIHASPVLSRFTTEFASMLKHKAESIVERLGTVDQQGVSSVADFMYLQILNKYEPLFLHLADIPGIHPEYLYRILMQAEGELSTLCSSTRRPRDYVRYLHKDLTACLTVSLNSLKQLLSAVSDQRAIPLPLQEQNFGIRTASIPDKSMLESMGFVLAVKADVTIDVLYSQFVSQIKIGSIDNIRDLINLQLPGIKIKAMPVVPRALPYHAGYTYFELEKGSEDWAELSDAAAIAIHTSGEFKNLSLQLWAVRL